MTDYLNLPDGPGKLKQLNQMPGTEILRSPPGGLDEVPSDKALICVVDMGDYEAPGYIVTETEFANWVKLDHAPATWLLVDRVMADRLCPEAAEHRQRLESATERDADGAAHTDNLIPVGRASRDRLSMDAQQLRLYASVLRGELPGNRWDSFLTDTGAHQVAAADLDDIARHLESWAGQDWIAVITLSAERQDLQGPLPPFPGQP